VIYSEIRLKSWSEICSAMQRFVAGLARLVFSERWEVRV
jgi:hypothetical protein